MYILTLVLYPPHLAESDIALALKPGLLPMWVGRYGEASNRFQQELNNAGLSLAEIERTDADGELWAQLNLHDPAR